jgi:hypothetical protein
MPLTINCHPDWEFDIIKDTIKALVDSYLIALRRKEDYVFIGHQTVTEEVAYNVFTITSGEEFIGKFHIIENSGIITMKVEYENSSNRAMDLLWVNLLILLKNIFSNSLDKLQSNK